MTKRVGDGLDPVGKESAAIRREQAASRSAHSLEPLGRCGIGMDLARPDRGRGGRGTPTTETCVDRARCSGVQPSFVTPPAAAARPPLSDRSPCARHRARAMHAQMSTKSRRARAQARPADHRPRHRAPRREMRRRRRQSARSRPEIAHRVERRLRDPSSRAWRMRRGSRQRRANIGYGPKIVALESSAWSVATASA